MTAATARRRTDWLRSPERRRPLAGLAVATVLLALLSGCEPPGVLLPPNGLLRRVHLRGLATRPLVALTFDDGPNGRCTAEILDALAATGTPATFFVLGRNVRHGDNAALVARMAREGHTIGLHGWAHSANPLLVPSWAQQDMERARDVVVAALRDAGLDAPPPRFYRPPYGLVTGPVAEAAANVGLEIVEWTVSIEDWRPNRTATGLTDAVVAAARPGDVIVLHDGDETAQRSSRACVDRPEHAETVRRLVPALQARGLQIAPLAEVLGIPEALR